MRVTVGHGCNGVCTVCRKEAVWRDLPICCRIASTETATDNIANLRSRAAEGGGARDVRNMQGEEWIPPQKNTEINSGGGGGLREVAGCLGGGEQKRTL